VVSANAYLGIEGIVEALGNGADIIITGRVADPALFLAPLVHEFGWKTDSWDLLGKGTLIGHLLECGGQVTGGYYADPGRKDVPNLSELGFPIIEVDEAGEFIVTKVEGTGGLVTKDTCAEQMIYEIHDPEKYLTPDVVADFSKVSFENTAKDVVRATGASGHMKTDTLKVSIGYRDCFTGEGEISYGGPGCYERAVLAGQIVEDRLKIRQIPVDELRIEIIGVNSLYRNQERVPGQAPDEVRLRVAARTKKLSDAKKIGEEVETLYTNGPAGGGGATKSSAEIVSVASILISRDDVDVCVKYQEVK